MKSSSIIIELAMSAGSHLEDTNGSDNDIVGQAARRWTEEERGGEGAPSLEEGMEKGRRRRHAVFPTMTTQRTRFSCKPRVAMSHVMTSSLMKPTGQGRRALRRY